MGALASGLQTIAEMAGRLSMISQFLKVSADASSVRGHLCLLALLCGLIAGSTAAGTLIWMLKRMY